MGGKSLKRQVAEALANKSLPDILEVRRGVLRARVNQRRDRLGVGVFTDSQGRRWDAKESDQRKFGDVATFIAAGGSLPDGWYWTDADNIQQPLTGADVLALMGEMMAWTNSIHVHANAIKAELDAAQTIEELDAVDIAGGWPV